MTSPVEELLVKRAIPYKVSGKDFVISCLNPDHEDSNPSFRVDKTTGICHCFSCGFKTNIFTFFGLSNNFVSIKTAKLKEKLTAIKQFTFGVEFPDEVIPFSKSFRGLNVKTLKHFEAFYTTSEKLGDRIFFPINDIRGKPVAYIGRHIHSSGNPRYLIYPSGVQLPIYPEFHGDTYNSVVLVEGIFDMLNLWDKGLKNVSCTFGTSTLFKDTDTKLMSLKAQGISKIYIMYDGDTPGRDAAKKLKPLIEECGYFVEIVDLEDNTDPGDMSQEYVDSLKEYVNK